MHLTGYYGKFGGAFGSILALLTSLVRKGVGWQWVDEQEFALERMEMMLTTKPFFKYPNFDCRYDW
jgi:hypothetical protein